MTTNDKPSKNDFNPASCETNVVGSASFVCKNCNHELPKTFSVKTDQYCYLCDPKVTLEECLQKDYPKTWKK